MKFDNNKSLSESVIMQGLTLAESARWRDYSSAIREGYKSKHKRSIPENILATTATLLENTYQWANRMDETTRSVNLGSFVDYGFDVISATVPNLIAHDILSVQPMNAKHGAIFYLQYLYGSNKGSIQSKNVMNSPFSGQHEAFNFSNDVVDGESIGTGNGSTTTFQTNLSFTPIRNLAEEKGFIVVHVGGVEVAKATKVENGVATIEGNGYSGTVDLGSGAINVTATTAPAVDQKVTVTYRYNMDLTEVGFSQVDLDLQSVSLEAFPRKLRARWLLDAAFELQKMKGIDAESELVVALSSEIKHEIDGELLYELYKQAALAGYTWSAKLPTGAAISYLEYKNTIIDMFTQMSNDIFTATRRVGANFIVAGVNVCNIIETLPDFEAEFLGTKVINGPHFVGTLCKRWKVYKNPYYGANNFVMGYKGESYLDAGYVYAPYMPLYATPTHVEDDFIFRKGLATSYGQVMLNDKLYAKGSITDFNDPNRMSGGPIVIQTAG
ncbi:MAG: hypothetical protein IJE61_05415 [Bacteroidales bacterium]|nr:hypothetical protein [Bacteroidales bacterium]